MQSRHIDGTNRAVRWRALAGWAVLIAGLWVGGLADVPAARGAGPLLALPPTVGDPEQLPEIPLAEPHTVWLVNARYTSCDHRHCNGAEHLRYYRRVGCQWVRSSLEAFLLEDDPCIPTCIFMHGNRYDADDSITYGMKAYRRIAGMIGPQQPMRFVIWSWPADQIPLRPLKDVKVKAYRSDKQGYYMAWFINQIHPWTPVAMLGHSYGARGVCCALHLLGGGRVDNLCLEDPQPRHGCLTAVLLAAAIEYDWLEPNKRFGRALDVVDSMMLTVNPEDPALRLFTLLRSGPGPEAAGYAGIASPSRLGPNGHKFTQIDVERWVNGNHGFQDYFGSREVMAIVVEYLFVPHLAKHP